MTAPGTENESGCERCVDVHPDPKSRSWGAFANPNRRGDGAMATIIVCPSNGSHISETDVEALRQLLRDAGW